MKSLTISMTLFLVFASPSFAQEKKDQPAVPMGELVPEIAQGAPDNEGKVLGKYLKPAANEVGVVLTSPVEKLKWVQLTPDQPVKSGQTYLALPGCRGDLHLGQLKLSLVGLLPEIVPAPSLLESMIDLHQHDMLAVDLTLWRGRIVLTSEAEKAVVRIRFENTRFAEQGEIIDLLLLGKETQVLIDRGGRMRPGKHFFEDPKAVGREPPGAFLGIWVLKGHAAIRYGNVRYSLASPPGLARLIWSSLGGLKTPETVKELPPIVSLNPPLPEEPDPARLKLRNEILKARDGLARQSADRPISERLAAACKTGDVAQRIMAIRCLAAIGDVPDLLERMIDERDPQTWLASMDSVKHWMAASRDNEYRIFEGLQKSYSKGVSFKIMELLHGLSKPDALVEFLDNHILTIRQMAHLNLCEVVPQGKQIKYDPTMETKQRQAAQQEWHKLLEKVEKK
jgi:hypothetical protein